MIADDGVIASHERLFDRDQVSYDWQHYIPSLSVNREPYAMVPRLPTYPSHYACSGAGCGGIYRVIGS